MVSKVRKRDGRVVDFDPGKIARAIEKAMVDCPRKNSTDSSCLI